MWELIVKLRDTAQAAQFIQEIDTRGELATGTVRLIKYPDDGQVVARSVDRAPLAGLATWALTFTSSRLVLQQDSGGDEYM